MHGREIRWQPTAWSSGLLGCAKRVRECGGLAGEAHASFLAPLVCDRTHLCTALLVGLRYRSAVGAEEMVLSAVHESE